MESMAKTRKLLETLNGVDDSKYVRARVREKVFPALISGYAKRETS